MGIQYTTEESGRTQNVHKEPRFQESLMTSAKRKSILGLMDSHGIEYFRQSGGHASRYCPACGESSTRSNKCNISNELWKCFACGEGGSVVDYAMHLWSTDEITAAKQLAADTVILEAVTKPGQPSAFKEPKVDLIPFYKKLQEKAPRFNMQAYMYLVKERGLTEKTLKEACVQGILRFLPGQPADNAQWLRTEFGDAELKRLGLWKEGSRMPWVAYRPIIFLLPSMKSAEWRICTTPNEGEKKAIRFGEDIGCWHWKGVDSTKVSVVEGAIDMLSMAQMGWRGDIKALPGAGIWEDTWLDSYHFAALTLDNDEAGKTAAEKISKVATEKGIPNTIRLPEAGDINKELLRRKAG